jgi:hypothetical protein
MRAPQEWNNLLRHCSASRIQGFFDYGLVAFSLVLKSVGNKAVPIIPKNNSKAIQDDFLSGMVPVTPGCSPVIDFGMLSTGFHASACSNRRRVSTDGLR